MEWSLNKPESAGLSHSGTRLHLPAAIGLAPGKDNAFSCSTDILDIILQYMNEVLTSCYYRQFSDVSLQN